jgi:glycosyltransferase involved in cell wall biosynthesis
MRIVHVIDSGGLYGAERVLLELAAQTNELGHEALVLSMGRPDDPDKPIETEGRRRGLDVRAVRVPSGPSPRAVRALLRAMAEERAAIVHTHGYRGDILLGWLPRWIQPRPLVATVHGYTDVAGSGRMRAYSWLDRRTLPRFDRVVLVHAGMRAVAGLDDPRWIVIENGVGPAPGAPPRDERLAAFSQGHFVIGGVGRLSVEKGWLDLVAALAELLRSGLDVRLVLVGDGPQRAEIEAALVTAGIRDAVLLTGFVDDARALLPGFDLFVLPSHTEGLPLTVLEAMHAGVPVVATRVGGVPSVLAEGRGGLVVPPADPRALAAACRAVLERPEEAAARAAFAAEEARMKYTSTAMAARYVAMYEGLMSGRPQG